jgi:hypothetical protein
MMQTEERLGSDLPMYWLAPHLHVCRAGQHFILLDVRNDRYLGFPVSAARELARRIGGWPTPPGTLNEASTSDGSHSTESGKQVFEQMLREHMVTTDRTIGRVATPVTVPNPETALIEGYADIQLDIHALDVARFLLASLKAALMLRWRKFDKVVGSVSRRHAGRSSALSPVQYRRLVGIFCRLRPLIFTSRDRCLFDSLVLAHYLAMYGAEPQWIFGVASDPFAAHCWLQDGPIVLNDTPENVRQYTPIFAA